MSEKVNIKLNYEELQLWGIYGESSGMAAVILQNASSKFSINVTPNKSNVQTGGTVHKICRDF